MHPKHCGGLIKQIHCAMQKSTNNDLRNAGLTFSQVHMLFKLSEQPGGGCSLKELERLLGVAQSTTAGIVRRCEEKGLVECCGDAEDRRAKYARITDRGLAICQTAKDDVDRSEERLLSRLTPEEADTLIRLLGEVYAALSDPEPDHQNRNPDSGKETTC